MPPLINLDDDKSQSPSEDEIPARKTKEESEEEGDEEDDEDDSVPEDEYVVEKILSHAFDEDGSIKYEVKWLGYEKKSDRTWEPEENLATAQDTLEAYFKSIGGRPKFQPKEPKGKGKRKQSVGASSTPAGTPAAGRGRGRKKAKTEEETGSNDGDSKIKLPAGSWEDHVASIDTIEELPNPKTGAKERHVYLVWKDGRKSTHRLQVANQKCPQKMLAYYEQHLTFKSFDDATTNGGNGNGEMF